MEENIAARTESRRLPRPILNLGRLPCAFIPCAAESRGQADPNRNHSGRAQRHQWPTEVIPLDPAQHPRCTIALQAEKEPRGDVTRRAEHCNRAKLRPRHVNLSVTKRVAHNRGEIEAANPWLVRRIEHEVG